MERKNRLLNFKNKVIYQNDEWFMLSIDSLLLANFVTIRPSDKKIVDLATGNAPIAMFLTYRTKAKIFGIELQEEIVNLANKSIKENNMDKQIEIFNIDIKDLNKIILNDSIDVITCNPPYFKTNSKNHLNKNDVKSIARHEVKIDINTILKVAKATLKNKGIFAMVHDSNRFMEILMKMRENNIEPKKIQFVYPKNDKNSNIVLIEGMKNGASGVKILPPLILHKEDGNYQDNIKEMFGDDYYVAKEL